MKRKQTPLGNTNLIWILSLTSLLLALVFVYFKYLNTTPFLKISTKDRISAVILPHQNVLQKEQANLLKKVAENIMPETIILISPNISENNQSLILTTDQNQKLANAIFSIDKDKVKKLTNLDKNISVNDLNFSEQFKQFEQYKDSNLLSNINQSFPDAKLLPLVLKSDLTKDQISILNNELEEVCSQNCLLISAVDFSKIQPESLAVVQNDFTIQMLENLDIDNIYRAETQSNQALALTILWAKNHGTEKFNLVQNTNGSVLADYETGEKVVSSKITFVIGGDMMLDRAVDAYFRGDKLVNVVKNLDSVFQGTNESIVNLEGPISATPIEVDTTVDNLVFNFPLKTPDVLKWLGINGVSLANNHTNNASKAGLENTHKVLEEAGIVWVGGSNFDADNSVREFGSGSQKLAIITINNLSSTDDLSGLIQVQKKIGNFVLVFSHWGNEYQTKHSTLQGNLAKSWIDAGADIVIGSHPHVIQDMEIYNNKPIIYSLGNLVFDQTFSTETKQGLVVAGSIDKGKIKLVLIPIAIRNLQPEVMTGVEKERIIDKLKESAGLPTSNHDTGYDTIEIE